MMGQVLDHPAKTDSRSYLKRGSGPRLVACSSIIRGKVFSLEMATCLPVVFGANAACEYVISGSTMTEFHALIEEIDGAWMLSVIDPEAQVWVNNEPVQVAVLDHGDQVQFGRHLLVFLQDEAKDSLYAVESAQQTRFFRL
ncbi:MAG: FHA domain-containing protein [Pseudomonadales bacterium]|nr:FHA domain-containing protein [Pseudomonadales bacterium]